jgi:ubiquinone/menaquinone biosynthesis C-methylase UbiE
MENHSFDKWKEFYLKACETNTEQLWPSESLVRLFKGRYIKGLGKDYVGKRVLEVGFGSGNNLIFLNSVGLKLYGTEVTEEICELYSSRLNELNIKAVLKQGTNSCLPFGDNMFDYLVSWNVIHYESTEENMMKAIKEYSRVLKPGGRIFISTTGPENSILRDCNTLGNHLYEINRKDTFRKGEIYFYFDNEHYVKQYFGKYFGELQIGRSNTNLFTECLDWFLITGLKMEE